MKYRVWHIKEERYIKDTWITQDDKVLILDFDRDTLLKFLNNITDEVIVEWGVEVKDWTEKFISDVFESDVIKAFNSYSNEYEEFIVEDLSQWLQDYGYDINETNIYSGGFTVIGTIHDKEVEEC